MDIFNNGARYFAVEDNTDFVFYLQDQWQTIWIQVPTLSLTG